MSAESRELTQSSEDCPPRILWTVKWLFRSEGKLTTTRKTETEFLASIPATQEILKENLQRTQTISGKYLENEIIPMNFLRMITMYNDATWFNELSKGE